jgi:hypothetical protein
MSRLIWKQTCAASPHPSSTAFSQNLSLRGLIYGNVLAVLFRHQIPPVSQKTRHWHACPVFLARLPSDNFDGCVKLLKIKRHQA